jgi:hypothetical protein
MTIPCFAKTFKDGCGNDATQILNAECCGALFFFCVECPTKLRDFPDDEMWRCEFCNVITEPENFLAFFSILD